MVSPDCYNMRKEVNEVEFLYKYVSPNRKTWILQDKLIRFTQPGEFNDPFEMRPLFRNLSYRGDFDTVFKVFIKSPTPYINALYWDLKTRFDGICKDFNDGEAINLLGKSIGILSLTEKPNNLLMWAHYADAHKGFVIKFDKKHSFFNSAQKVIYDNNRETESLLVEVIKEESFLKRRDIQERLLNILKSYSFKSSIQREIKRFVYAYLTGSINFDVFRIKSKEWEHEQEWRILDHKSKAHKIVSPDKPDEKDLFLFKIPPEAIKSVILGCRMEENIKKDICDILKDEKNNLTHVELQEADINRNRFKLDINCKSYHST